MSTTTDTQTDARKEAIRQLVDRYTALAGLVGRGDHTIDNHKANKKMVVVDDMLLMVKHARFDFLLRLANMLHAHVKYEHGRERTGRMKNAKTFVRTIHTPCKVIPFRRPYSS